MLTPFDIWSTVIRAPFSGDVTQEITPRFLSPDIKGSPILEDRIQREVASYGKQLGKVLEALQVLAANAGIELEEIDALVAEIEAVKDTSREALRADAEAALVRLREVDEDGWREVSGTK